MILELETSGNLRIYAVWSATRLLLKGSILTQTLKALSTRNVLGLVGTSTAILFASIDLKANF